MKRKVLIVQGHPDPAAAEFEQGAPPAAIAASQEDVAWADHLVLLYPLWLGTMPAFFYRWYYRAHSLKNLERNILGFCGIKPIRDTLIEQGDDAKRQVWLDKLRRLGEQAL